MTTDRNGREYDSFTAAHPFEVRLLNTLEELRTTLHGEKDDIGVALGRQAQVTAESKSPSTKRLGNEPIDVRFFASENPEGIILHGLGRCRGWSRSNCSGYRRIMGEILVGDEILSCDIEFTIVSVELKKSALASI